MNAQPLRCFLPPSTIGCGFRGKSEEKGDSVKMVEVKEEASELEGPWMRLGLGIGATGCTPVDKQEEKKKLVEKKRKYDCDDDHCGQSLFTEKQWRELQDQAIIYKYIASGLPVHLGLVVPIWKSIASPLGSGNGGISRIYPSLLGLSPQGYDNKNMKDPEPLRCRRTDGKKWRCGKNVVTGQKYCERHMHRGRLRSRKLVEASPINPSSDAVMPNSSSPTCSVSNSSPQLVTRKESVSHSAPSTSSNVVETKTINTTMTSGAFIADRSTGMTLNASSITSTSHWIKPSTPLVDTNNKRSGIDITNHPVDKRQNNFGCPISSKNVLDRSGVDKNPKNLVSRKSQGMNFSPKSVLPNQGGRSRSSSLCQIDLEVEPWRCKRTDGKKWRCRRNAIASEKYCVMHMHRGAKKPAGTSQPGLLATGADVSARPCPQPTQTVSKKTYCSYLNINLSISVPASPTTASATSSDATISDTIIGHEQ